jgi:hypothetical protein
MGFSQTQTLTVFPLSNISHCQGDTVWFSFSSTGTFSIDNVFAVEIGQSNGQVFSPAFYLGNKTSTGNGLDSVMVIIPGFLPKGLSNFVYRIVSTSPVVTSNTIDSIVLHSNPEIQFTSSDTVYCITHKATQLSISDTGYTAIFHGDGISNNSFLPISAGEGHHFMYCTITNQFGCSTTDSLKINVISTPIPDLLSNEYTTPNSSISVVAYGTEVTWYSDSLLTNVISNLYIFQYIIPNGDTGIHYIYPTQTLNQCESNANKITVIYRPKIVTTICLAQTPRLNFPNTTTCAGRPISDVTAHYTGINNIVWYDGINTTANKVSNNAVFHFNKQNEPGNWTYYAFEYDTINNCYSKDGAQYTITVFPLPVLSLDIADTVCNSTNSIQIHPSPDKGTLTVNDTNLLETYLFYPRSVLIHNSSAKFHYSYSDNNGCINTLDKSIFVKFTEMPTNSDATGYMDSIPQLYAIGEDKSAIVYWYNDRNQAPFLIGQYYTPQIPSVGIYTYYVSQFWNGCSSDIIPIQLTITEGSKIINSFGIEETEFQVYPVPSNKSVTIKNINSGIVEIYTAQGTKVLSRSIENGTVSLQELPTGVYFLQVYNNGTKFVTKIIKD